MNKNPKPGTPYKVIGAINYHCFKRDSIIYAKRYSNGYDWEFDGLDERGRSAIQGLYWKDVEEISMENPTPEDIKKHLIF